MWNLAIFVSVYLYTYINTYVSICKYKISYIRIFICINICVYIHIYVYTWYVITYLNIHMNTFINIHIHIYSCDNLRYRLTTPGIDVRWRLVYAMQSSLIGQMMTMFDRIDKNSDMNKANGNEWERDLRYECTNKNMYIMNIYTSSGRYIYTYIRTYTYTHTYI
jgi:hypothetical protein